MGAIGVGIEHLDGDLLAFSVCMYCWFPEGLLIWVGCIIGLRMCRLFQFKTDLLLSSSPPIPSILPRLTLYFVAVLFPLTLSAPLPVVSLTVLPAAVHLLAKYSEYLQATPSTSFTHL